LHSNLSPFARCSSFNSSMFTTLESITLIGLTLHNTGRWMHKSARYCKGAPRRRTRFLKIPRLPRL
jgi:hypothetical protein